MDKLKREVEIDYEKYSVDENMLETYYGLPREVKFCKKCVTSNQRPNSTQEFKHTRDSKKVTIRFDEEGVCAACRTGKEKESSIDWRERERELIDLCNKYRKADGSYDCIVPGSGGKDSFYAAHILKYKYNMHPLTVTWAPHIYTSWGWDNFQNWIHSGFDNYLCTPNGRVHRLLTRLAVENIYHPFQPFIIGQKVLMAKLAIQFNIPLVFYGENEAEYGTAVVKNNASVQDKSFMAIDDKMTTSFGGVSARELIDNFGLDMVDLGIYMPVDVDEFEKKKIEVRYLGYFLKWHPQEIYYYAVENSNFKPAPERTAGTYSKYSSIDDKIDDLHYYTTYIKFGIGRATEDASQEIRNGEITREEGIALVKKYDGEFPKRFEKELWQYLSIDKKEFPIASERFEEPLMDRDYFLHLADRFRSPHLWKYEKGMWKLRHTVYEGESECDYGRPMEDE